MPHNPACRPPCGEGRDGGISLRTRHKTASGRFLVILYALACLLAFGPVPVRAADDPKQVALAFVQASGAGNNLKQLSFAAAQFTTTYRMVVQKKGEAEARHLLAEEVLAIAPQYQDQWNRNLADAYLLHCTPEQLASVTKDKQGSPFFQSVVLQRSAAGEDMQKSSSKLLKDMVAAVLLGLFKQITPPG